MNAQYIQARQLSRSYNGEDGPIHALSEVSFTIDQGQYIGLVGSSGAGKSTLLSLLGGLDRPSTGQLRVGGTDLQELDDRRLALYRRQTVGFIFQDFRLLPALTVLENVMLPLVPIASSETDKLARTEAALDEVNIAHRASHLPGQLSGGEQQRAAVARAIVNDPEIVLADEPTGELDADNASLIMDILQRLHDEARTVIVASHDAATIANTEMILRIEEGVLVTES